MYFQEIRRLTQMPQKLRSPPIAPIQSLDSSSPPLEASILKTLVESLMRSQMLYPRRAPADHPKKIADPTCVESLRPKNLSLNTQVVSVYGWVPFTPCELFSELLHLNLICEHRESHPMAQNFWRVPYKTKATEECSFCACPALFFSRLV